MKLKLGFVTIELNFNTCKYLLTQEDADKFEELFKTGELVEAAQLLQEYWPKESQQRNYLLGLEGDLISLQEAYAGGITKEFYSYMRSRRDSIAETLLNEHRHISYRT